MKKLIILRGLPGSGKSTKTKELIEEYKKDRREAYDAYYALSVLSTPFPLPREMTTSIRSTDALFVVDGTYRFDPTKLGMNHHRNQRLVEQDMLNGTELIIVDNTNIKRRDFQNYVNLAQLHGYKVEEITIGGFDDEFVNICFKRNQHGVPLEAIKRMAANFEA